MNKGLWIARKNHLFCLIKKVSKAFGGDEEKDVKLHFEQVIDTHPDEKIEDAIESYTRVLRNISFYGSRQ